MMVREPGGEGGALSPERFDKAKSTIGTSIQLNETSGAKIMGVAISLDQYLRFAAVVTLLTGCAALRAQEVQPAAGPDKPAAVTAPNKSDDSPSSEDATALAKKLQNPIGHLYNIPFQSNTNFSVGPNHGTQEILNIQPVIPFHINEDWIIIARTIVPVIWNPSFQPEHTVPQGIGPRAERNRTSNLSAMHSPT
jgi:hypothetical protein